MNIHQPVKCKMVSTKRDDISQIYINESRSTGNKVMISSNLISGEQVTGC